MCAERPAAEAVADEKLSLAGVEGLKERVTDSHSKQRAAYRRPHLPPALLRLIQDPQWRIRGGVSEVQVAPRPANEFAGSSGAAHPLGAVEEERPISSPCRVRGG